MEATTDSRTSKDFSERWGRKIRGDRAAVEERLGEVHPFPGLRPFRIRTRDHRRVVAHAGAILLFLAEAALPKLVWRHESETVGLMSVQAVRLAMPRPVTTPPKTTGRRLAHRKRKRHRTRTRVGRSLEAASLSGAARSAQNLAKAVGNNQQMVTWRRCSLSGRHCPPHVGEKSEGISSDLSRRRICSLMTVLPGSVGPLALRGY